MKTFKTFLTEIDGREKKGIKRYYWGGKLQSSPQPGGTSRVPTNLQKRKMLSKKK